jgi:multicomponent K+:H+ antiporter subunit E
MWLLLNQAMGVADLLLAAVLAVVIPRLMAPLRPPAGPMHRPLVLVRLVAHVAVDVVTSALAVARGVLRSKRRPPRGAFVVVPLELRNPHGLAALSMITNVVPGTVWCEADLDRGGVRLHVFDVDDEAAFIEHYKHRYEQPLREIFE